MATNVCSSFFLLSTIISLFLFGCSEKVEAYRFEEMTPNLQLNDGHDISIKKMMPDGHCSIPPQGSEMLSGSEISCSKHQIYYKDGPCSPRSRVGDAKNPSNHQILIDDQTRVKSIHSKLSNQDPMADSAVKLRTNSGQSLGTGNYVVKIGLGTPKNDFALVFDTGSDLTWTKCQPCLGRCYAQKDPIFNPFASSTYSNIPCNSATCAQLQSATGNTQSCDTTCIYQIEYGNNSFSAGYFATDTLTLSSSDVFPNFKFGCGQANKVLFGPADGLLGLGRDQVSVVSQTAQKYGKRFSYCLPSKSSFIGFLAFGSEAGVSSSVQYTPLLSDSNNPSFYFLTMTGISVGGRSLNIPQSVFTTSGTIIDSGTVITRLPPTAYRALRAAFRRAMSEYPPAPASSILDTCYNLAEYTQVTVPTIVLHFGGGTDLDVDQSGILLRASSTQYCLAFAGNNDATDMAILGNKQQRTFEVVYDVAGGKLGFGTGACS